LSIALLTFTAAGLAAAGVGCAGVKGKATASGGSNGSGNGGSNGNGGSSSGSGGGGGNLPVTPITGSHTCSDFDSNCTGYNTNNNGTLDNGGSGSTSIVYPLDHALFPANLGPIQVQMSTSGSAARIHFLTTQSSNVDVQYYGACESAPGSGCVVTLPVAFTRMLIPACQTEDIQMTARVMTSSSSATGDSSPVNVAWASAAVTGGLYYWTVIPNTNYCNGATDGNPTPNPPNYCLLDVHQNPKNGTAIYRYDFAQDNPKPQQVWTDDGGPGSNPAYDGAPQAWNNGTAGGHCIGCHSITNDGKFMGLTIGGSSTYNAANWELLDIQNQGLFEINPSRTGGNGCNDSSASPTNDIACYWEQYRKDQLATEMAWGPDDTVMVSMYRSKLYFNQVSATQGQFTSATITQTGAALPNSASKIDPYQSDPFWSHDGSWLVYTSFSQAAPADSTGNPSGLNGDLKTGGRIAIASATGTSINDDAKILVDRQNNKTSYYPVISEDSNWVVYNQSDCGGNPSGTDINYNGTSGYGTGVCDGYDDSTAKLYLTSIDGNTQLNMDNANGSSNYDNSWPRFSPDVSTFRGQTLYWVAFSSRRPYGSQLNTSGLSSSQPQLWFAALTLSEVNAGDPSWAPVWLPGQNPDQTNPYGNHVPQWVKVAIVIDQP
jgi:hypothetical protein